MRDTVDTADPRRWWTLAVLCLSLLVIGLDNTILNVALPTLQRDLGASSSQLQWIVDAYMLVFAGLLLTAGALGDRFGRKRALTFGLAVFGARLRGCRRWPTSPEMLIATRALMGVGGAFIMPSTLSILTADFPANERGEGDRHLGRRLRPRHRDRPGRRRLADRARELELRSSSSTCRSSSPRWSPAAGSCPSRRDPAAPRLDLARLRALDRRPDRARVGDHRGAVARLDRPDDPRRVRRRRRRARRRSWPGSCARREPMLDVRLFRNPRFSAASAAITLAFFAMFGSIFFLTQYLQDVLGYTALEAGLRVLPGRRRPDPRRPAVGASSTERARHQASSSPPGSRSSPSALSLRHAARGRLGLRPRSPRALLVLGFGMGMAMAPATESVMGSLPLAKASVGSAVNDTTRTTGGALGVAVLGSLLASGYRGDMDAAVSGLPHGAAATRAATRSAARWPWPHRSATARLADAAQTAFVSGMHTAALVAAAVALAGAIVALRLPAGARAPSDAAGAARRRRSPA